MSETSNYHLYVTDDDTERFWDWRNKMNGVANSNMTKIDTVLSEKADSSTAVSGVLSAAQWEGEQAPYSYRLSVAGMGAEQNGNIAIASTATAAQKESARKALLSILSQEENTLVIAADGAKPAEDIPVTIILIG